MPAGDVVDLLERTPLQVGWLGFMPGFAYLVGLPEPLASLPRLARPRTRVAAGSFALAGGYAGIYPLSSPGGWNVLGRTVVRLFDSERSEPATLAPGDVLHVRPVDSLASLGPGTADRRRLTATGGRRLVVEDAGTLTLVEDLGRVGFAHLGVGRAGPADPLRHRIANLAVGNPATSALLEVTASGPTLRFACAAHVALVGDCVLRIDGREMPPSTVQLVEAGQTVAVGIVRRGLRGYLAVSGGITSPAVLGSRASDAGSRLGSGPLRAGDELDLGQPGRPRGRFFEPGFGAVLSVEAGPDAAGGSPAPEGGVELLAGMWEVAPESDRVGIRLRPADPATRLAIPAGGLRQPPAELQLPAAGMAAEVAGRLPAIPSRATVTGAVQLPPDGCPVILGADHGTVGGYPIVAVLTLDSGSSAGQLRPGDFVSFDPAGPRRASLASQAARAVAGWMPGGPVG